VTEGFAERAGGPRIRYVVEGQGEPLTLVHGVGANLQSWDDVAKRLTPHFKVVRMDLRGHGSSGRIADCTLDDLADDVRLVWDTLGIRRSHLAGFSLGGLIAQSLALSDAGRIDRLAIISAVAGRTPEERAKVGERLRILREKGIAAISNAAETRWFTDEFRAAHPERIKARMAELLANDPPSYAACYTVFCTSDLGDKVHGIRHPTLVVTGQHDVGSNARMARFMREQIKNSTLRILPALRHSVLVEAPEQIAFLLLDFLRPAASASAGSGSAAAAR
jgi:(E)-2-((N-methylformamido)methylene)succinate hydrolase